MSGICGLFNLDEAPATESDVQSMTTILDRRGPDRNGNWIKGSVGLGHTLFITTPQLKVERQPVVHSDTGCVITADVRLDNRAELLRVLALTDEGESIGDAGLILNAYLAWGDACVDRLLGDFAFAVYDPRDEKLLFARDHSGLRSFYYHHTAGRRFAFGSSPQSILVLPGVPYSINDGRIADFLVPALEWIDYTSTFFDGVFRLPPGHRGTVTRSSLNIVEYWKPSPGANPGPLPDGQLAQGFLEVFTRAVDARLHVPEGAVGSMMSGGMDSGTVVAVGKDLLANRGAGPLPTFSVVRGRDVDCSESRAIYAASDMPGIAPTLIDFDMARNSYPELSSGYEEPFDGILALLKAVYLAASENGQRVVLDGAGGDTLLDEGTYIVRLIRQFQLRLAFAEITAEGRFWGDGQTTREYLRYGFDALVPWRLRATYRSLRARQRLRHHLSSSLISREFAEHVNIEQRFERLKEMFPYRWTPDYGVERCKVIRPSATGGRERYARIAATAPIEASDPFLDKRVIEYSAWLPGRLRLRDGWPKIVLRELMADRLPDPVRWTRGKPHLGWRFNAAVTREAIRRDDIGLSDLRSELASYIDVQSLERAWKSFHDESDPEPLHAARVLSVWLRENANRPFADARNVL